MILKIFFHVLVAEMKFGVSIVTWKEFASGLNVSNQLCMRLFRVALVVSVSTVFLHILVREPLIVLHHGGRVFLTPQIVQESVGFNFAEFFLIRFPCEYCFFFHVLFGHEHHLERLFRVFHFVSLVGVHAEFSQSGHIHTVSCLFKLPRCHFKKETFY